LRDAFAVNEFRPRVDHLVRVHDEAFVGIDLLLVLAAHPHPFSAAEITLEQVAAEERASS
jgi:hypothetical protein